MIGTYALPSLLARTGELGKLACVIAAGMALGIAASNVQGQTPPNIDKTAANHRVVPVKRGIVTLEITERGTLEPVKSDDVICTLKNRSKTFATTIKRLVEDGSSVKKGDKLVEFDDGILREDATARALELGHARAAAIKARENLKMAQAESAVDIKLMETALQLAELRLRREKGSDRDAKEELQLKVEQARLGLMRVQAQARAKEAVAKAEVEAKSAVVISEDARKKELDAELAKCVLFAPRSGIVQYFVPEAVRGGGLQQTIAAVGEPVREGQKLMQIPDLTQWQVKTRVHEALVAHLRNMDPKNQENRQVARIVVDAFPTQTLTGHVKTVDNVASVPDFFATDVKVYKTIVAVDTPMPGLKPGMSAEVRILAKETGPVLYVPVTAVIGAGKKRACVVANDKVLDHREVETGLSNDRFIEIKAGLKEGESVLAAPREWLRRFDPPMNDGKPAGNKVQARDPKAYLTVRSVKPAAEGIGRSSWVQTYGLTYRDLDRIAVLPSVAEAVPARHFPNEARRFDRVALAQITATTPSFAELCGLTMAEGRFLCADDDLHFRNVAVIGPGVEERLLSGEESLGATLVINGQPYVVVGVLEGEQRMSPALPEADVKNAVILPLRTCHARFGERMIIRRGNSRYAEAVPLHSISVALLNKEDVTETAAEIRAILEQAHLHKDWSIQEATGP